MKILYTRVKLPGITLNQRDASKLRGFFADKYCENNLMHNHIDGKFIYEYPRVQYKVIENKPVICGIGDMAKEIAEIGMWEKSIVIEEQKFNISEREVFTGESEIGASTDYILYSFLSPWIAINQHNMPKYLKANEMEKEEMLKSILIGNFLSMSKGIGYSVEKKLNVWLDLKEIKVNIKDISMIAFKGKFKINFLFPDFLGIGKAVSKGYGTVKRI